eukprot:m51a1_g6663 putative C-tail anchored protein (77) ;mRNA; f:171662-171892
MSVASASMIVAVMSTRYSSWLNRIAVDLGVPEREAQDNPWVASVLVPAVAGVCFSCPVIAVIVLAVAVHEAVRHQR